jgi:transcription initiation factor TFIIH subunit 2
MVSDDDYVEVSDDDIDIRATGRDAAAGTRSKSTRANKESSGFEVTRTWENLTEGADGTITGAVEGLLQAGKRQRLSASITQENHWLRHPR